MMKNLLIAACILVVSACNISSKKEQENAKNVKVELQTAKGNIILQLSDETPLHRDNFIKLVNQKYFDGILFHRVINGFGIQSGDPDSKNAQPGEALGNGGPGYTIPAEINTKLFHKRGALNAARDNNPDRASAGSQFFIVQGKVQNDSTLNKAETRINGWLAEHAFVNDPANKAIRDSLISALKEEDGTKLMQWADLVYKGGKTYTNYDSYQIPEEHRAVYKEIGGAPHLDQNYTVFGEVLEGMDIVDQIAAMEVDSLDRPVEDVKIITARIIK
ncbi:peptidylprolyl isomerase [Carboxylicivirga linearis]|uniref:peptidylprolyl isomerase n=1 Tax=Carboxylicivirga linearis TaxID=1628157 RepID=A0ABS5K2L7_9BACT|nr:peptidylprolyl isomerase [Carboxylicivirga linearis]MBS2100921.1 peptidylprolyl isomerase [Carboxylicivirga linearis]